MSNLKELKIRIDSTKSTQKITKAMQMVAASKLRKAQAQAESSRPYATKMEEVLSSLSADENASKMPLLSGKKGSHLLVIASSNKGLCGAFNSSIVKLANQEITRFKEAGDDFKIIFIGNKAKDIIEKEFGNRVIGYVELPASGTPSFELAEQAGNMIIEAFNDDKIGTASIIYNKFESPLVQETRNRSLIPLELDNSADNDSGSVYEFEPNEGTILANLLPRNIAVQVYRGMLENSASEQGARMTAMDNATRNAKDMIKSLTLKYNRSRQAAITTELIEIISGAEAL